MRCIDCFFVTDLPAGYTPEDLLRANRMRHEHYHSFPSARALRDHLTEQFAAFKPNMMDCIPSAIDEYQTYFAGLKIEREKHRNYKLAEQNEQADAAVDADQPKGLWLMRKCPRFSECGNVMVHQGGWWKCYEHGNIEQKPYSPPVNTRQPVRLPPKEVEGFSTVGSLLKGLPL